MQNISAVFIKSFYRFMNVSPIYIIRNFVMSILSIPASVPLLLSRLMPNYIAYCLMNFIVRLDKFGFFFSVIAAMKLVVRIMFTCVIIIIIIFGF